MATDESDLPSWAERAVGRSVQVQRSTSRAVGQAQAIVDAAERIVRSKGTMFTTGEIAKEAKIAIQTLYRHFGGVDELALAVIEKMMAEAVQGMEGALSGIEDPLARLEHLVRFAFSTPGRTTGGPTFMATERWRLQHLFPEEMEQARRPFIGFVEREVTRAAELGLIRTPSDPSADARLIAELVTAMYYDAAMSPSHEPLDAMADRVWAFCRAAISVEPTRKRR